MHQTRIVFLARPLPVTTSSTASLRRLLVLTWSTDTTLPTWLNQYDSGRRILTCGHAMRMHHGSVSHAAASVPACFHELCIDAPACCWWSLRRNWQRTHHAATLGADLCLLGSGRGGSGVRPDDHAAALGCTQGAVDNGQRFSLIPLALWLDPANLCCALR